MALKATVHKAELQISDGDRHYYDTHALTLAQHPSETDGRLMVRLLAFACFADSRLEFGRGLSSADEPDLWQKSLDGQIELWIDLGQPDESRVRRACGRARRVVVLGYSGRSFGLWRQKNSDKLQRLNNLDVWELPEGGEAQLAEMLQRGMSLQCLIQDQEMQWLDDSHDFTLRLVRHQQAKVSA